MSPASECPSFCAAEGYATEWPASADVLPSLLMESWVAPVFSCWETCCYRKGGTRISGSPCFPLFWGKYPEGDLLDHMVPLGFTF